MRVPDPEDPKYWSSYFEDGLWNKAFDSHRFIEDFRKWKAELQQLREALLSKPDQHPFSQLILNAKISLIEEILGEEASE